MTLRTRLVLALMIASLVPMGAALAVAMFQAGGRAREAAARRLETARRQTAIVIERDRGEAAARVAQVAAELGRDRPGAGPTWRGPAAPAAVVALAERFGLDHLEIRDPGGALVVVSDADPRSDPGVDLSLLEEGEAALRPFPYPASASDPRVGWFVRRSAAVGRERFAVIGGRVVGRPLLDAVAAITEAPAALLDPSGRVVAAGEGPDEAARRPAVGAAGTTGGAAVAPAPLSGAVPLGDGGWRVGVTVPAGDPGGERRALLVAFAGTAPLALASALVVGLLLAAGMARPIGALALRAEATAAEAAGEPLSPPQGGDEVRRLDRSMGLMLEALSASERERGAAERIAAWQEVARRIAHEIKNPLAPIRFAVENLRKTRRSAPGEFDRSFETETATILEEVESLRSLVEEFSSFSRLPPPRPVPCDLGVLAAQTLALFGPRLAAARVEVARSGEGAVGPVRADPEQIGRVLKNVVANALDSLEESAPGGERRLEVGLRMIDLPRKGATARFVEVAIRDTGRGFEPEALRRVFEPYYTTRAGRGGTGLGMSIAYRIVSDHGGRIVAEGSPGRGACVTLRLPVDGPSPAAPDPGAAPAGERAERDL